VSQGVLRRYRRPLRKNPAATGRREDGERISQEGPRFAGSAPSRQDAQTERQNILVEPIAPNRTKRPNEIGLLELWGARKLSGVSVTTEGRQKTTIGAGNVTIDLQETQWDHQGNLNCISEKQGREKEEWPTAAKRAGADGKGRTPAYTLRPLTTP
jgi:hypothetical protein